MVPQDMIDKSKIFGDIEFSKTFTGVAIFYF